MFSEGWKFDYKTQGPTGEIETQTCKVVEVLLNGKEKSDGKMVQLTPCMSMILKTANLRQCSDGHYGLEMKLNMGMIP